MLHPCRKYAPTVILPENFDVSFSIDRGLQHTMQDRQLSGTFAQKNRSDTVAFMMGTAYM